MKFKVKLSQIGSSNTTFTIKDQTGLVLATGVTAAQLLAGHEFVGASGVTEIIVSGDNPCFNSISTTNIVDVTPATTTSTTTTSTTTTTTEEPTTTTSTTTVAELCPGTIRYRATRWYNYDEMATDICSTIAAEGLTQEVLLDGPVALGSKLINPNPAPPLGLTCSAFGNGIQESSQFIGIESSPGVIEVVFFPYTGESIIESISIVC
jgi:hypothetical protein